MRHFRHFMPFILVGGAVGVSFFAAAEDAKPKPAAPGDERPHELVTFTVQGAELHGWIYKPQGVGPFPAVLYNHGSEPTPGWFPPLGKFWVDRGFVFFVPHRLGHGRSPGTYIVEEQKMFRQQETDMEKVKKHDVELHEKANQDVVGAVAWLKQQPFVKPDEVIVSGISYGGIQTVLTAEKDVGVKAFVAFSPAAMSWAGNPPLRERLLRALEQAKAPVFLLQAENDYHLGPMQLLGEALKKKGGINRAKLYPVFGDKNNPQDGHGGFAVRGSDVWGADVLEFVREVMKPPGQATR